MNGGTSMEAVLQDPDYMEMEGWQELSDSSVPYFGSYLNNAFSFLGISSSNNVVRDQQNSAEGMILPDDFEDDDDLDYQTTTVSHSDLFCCF